MAAIRVVATLVVIIFLTGVFMVMAPPGIEQVGSTVESNSAVAELGLTDVVGNLYTILFVGVPLLIIGGFLLWGILRLTRRERVTGPGGGGLR